MGNASSRAPTDSAEVLIHSFPLDADFDTCQIPFVCPRRQAMFQPPSSLPPSTTAFLTLAETETILAHLNIILHQTGFNPKVTNPCFLIALLSSVLFASLLGGFWIRSNIPQIDYPPPTDYDEPNYDEPQDDQDSGADDEPQDNEDSGPPSMLMLVLLPILMFLPYVAFFCAVVCYRRSRRSRLQAYAKEWNRSGTGVKLAFGGGGTTPQGVTVGSEFGGTYENLYMAMWDPKGILFKGYLHVFVNPTERHSWCGKNGSLYSPPVSLGSQAYQPPPGYVLVPSA